MLLKIKKTDWFYRATNKLTFATDWSFNGNTMQKGEATRELIIRTSSELFNTRGYYGSSMSDIMEATGLKKGGIYNHFENKDEIAFAAFDRSYSLVLKRFKEKLAACDNSEEKLRAMIEVFQSLLTNPIVKGGCPIFNTAVDSVDVHPKLQKKAKDSVNTLLKYVEIKVEEGKIENEFKASISAADFALLLVSTMEGAMMVSRVNGNHVAIKITAGIMNNYITTQLLK